MSESKVATNEYLSKIEEKSHISSSIHTLKIAGIVIKCREDKCVDATSLCEAGNKQFKHWHANKHAQEFIAKLSKEVDKSTSEIILIDPQHRAHTWVHPRIAINIAQWISVDFDLKVSKWIYELGVFGSVNLNQERSNAEIDAQYIKNKMSQLQTEFDECKLKMTREIALKTNELQNYEVINHLKLEQRTIDSYHEVFGDYKINRRVDKHIFYVLWIGTITINGVKYNVYKYGISRSGSVRMRKHHNAFGPTMKKLFVRPMIGAADVEDIVKQYLEDNDALCLIIMT